MTARHITERDRRTGAERRTWIVDFVFEHANGRVERVRKVSPVPTRRGADEYERQLRAALLEPVVPRKEVPTFGAFVDERWWPTYPAAAGNRHTTVREKESLVRVAARHRGHASSSGPGVARPLHDHDDDALLAPRSRRRSGVPVGAPWGDFEAV